MDFIIKDKTKGFVGRYRITKAKLERPEHFMLNDEIVAKRNELSSVQEQVKDLRSRKGILAFVRSRAISEEVAVLTERKDVLARDVHALTRQLNRICKTEVIFQDNIVPTVGRTLIANNLTDATPTNSMLISHAALGSSGTAVANGDTQLGTETYRNIIASITNASNVAYATAFFSATEVSGTFAEAGIFCDGTGTANSGILLSHVLISVTKSTSETLTIDWELTIN